MTIPIQRMFLLLFPVGQSESATGLGMDILIYIVMALGFMIIGFLASNFFNKARVQAMEAEVDSERERMSRRINTLEKEIKHLYAKNDEQIVIINNLNKEISGQSKTKPSQSKDSEKSDDHLDLFSESPQADDPE